MNVRGCVADGWWSDKEGALERVVEAISANDWGDEWIVVVADGTPPPGLRAGTRGQVELRYAGHSAPDAADDEIVALAVETGVDDGPLVVVTSDRGLIARLPDGVDVRGARSFRRSLGF